MFDLFDIGNIGFDDAALLMAAQEGVHPMYDTGLYAGDPLAADAVVDVESINETISKENAKRKEAKGGALVRQEGNYKRMGGEARRMRNDERVAHQLIQEKLGHMDLGRFGRRAAIGAALAGTGGLAVNYLQSDDQGGLTDNPYSQAALGTAMGLGAGGLTGFYTTPAQQTLSIGNQPQAVRVRPLDQVEQLGAARRRGLRGAAIGATGGALLALANQLRNNDPGQQNTYV
ncbi:hypothetical protein [Synechococcus sp. BIOS-E4-1]|uniref:hypothetical protein n=1 Tax=Synechococcus sp. BIOS-E4-1 TaxID=1400864 RepID=UPI001648599A|nr:hypothetical protein [Synechococcus sp. BIOS-E4-1]